MSQVITIDGPSGSGKGTIAAHVAEELGFNTLDSGALYRILALYCKKKGVGTDQIDLIAEYAKKLDVSFVSGRIYLECEEISDQICGEHIGAIASQIAVYPEIRKALLSLQKSFVSATGLVADGRDMGTQVFPDAELKIFLTASAEERAQRRHKQLISKGQGGSLRALVEDIQARDQRDVDRETAPLRPAEDSILIDSTGMTIDQVVTQIIELWRGAHK
jgi:cytidylate kinase